MSIIVLILIFLVMSISAASHGDWSGMEVIGKIVIVVVMFGVMAVLALNPVLFILVAIVALLLYFSK